MTQSIDLIALDLDGTLLAADESVSPGNRAAISRALKSGIRVVLAPAPSGKRFRSKRMIP